LSVDRAPDYTLGAALAVLLLLSLVGRFVGPVTWMLWLGTLLIVIGALIWAGVLAALRRTRRDWLRLGIGAAATAALLLAVPHVEYLNARLFRSIYRRELDGLAVDLVSGLRDRGVVAKYNPIVPEGGEESSTYLALRDRVIAMGFREAKLEHDCLSLHSEGSPGAYLVIRPDRVFAEGQAVVCGRARGRLRELDNEWFYLGPRW
jgi:hypothetical protein